MSLPTWTELRIRRLRQTQQFTATVTGSSNTAVTWSISPSNTGTISAAGLYTVPTTIASQQTVTVMARSQADTTKTKTATITLNPPRVITLINVDPSAAGPNTPISMTSSGYQSGVAIQNAIVTMTPQSGGSAVTTAAVVSGTVVGRSVNFVVPPCALAGNYNLTASGTGFVSGNSLAFTVYPPATISLAQASAKQGETLQVVITGSYTTFPAN